MSDETQEQSLARLREVSIEAGGVKMQTMADASAVCKMIHQSGIAPVSLDTPEKIFVAIQTGAEAGLSPMASVQSVYVVKGNAAWKGSAALALMRAHPNCDSCTVGTKVHATLGPLGFCATVRKGQKELQWEESTFTLEDAKKAGLTKGHSAEMYSKWTDDMLLWRAVSRHAKRYWSDALLGLDVVEVVRTYEEPPPKSGQPVDLPAEKPAGPDPLFDKLKTAPEAEATADHPPEPAAAEASGSPSITDQVGGKTPPPPDHEEPKLTATEVQVAEQERSQKLEALRDAEFAGEPSIADQLRDQLPQNRHDAPTVDNPQRPKRKTRRKKTSSARQGKLV